MSDGNGHLDLEVLAERIDHLDKRVEHLENQRDVESAKADARHREMSELVNVRMRDLSAAMQGLGDRLVSSIRRTVREVVREELKEDDDGD